MLMNETFEATLSDSAGAQPSLEQGEVDLSLIDYFLSLTPAQRAEKHYNARLFAQRMQQIARERYGSALDALEAAE